MLDIHKIPPEESYALPDVYLSWEIAAANNYISAYDEANAVPYSAKVVATISGNFTVM